MSLRGLILAIALAALCAAAVWSYADAPSSDLQAALQAESARVELVKKLEKTVCAIFPAMPEDGKPPAGPLGSGSGVIIDPDGWALSNYHVVGEAAKVNVGLSDGKIYPAIVKGRDPTGDIALVKLEGGPFTAAEMGDSDKLNRGDWVLAMGNPFGLATDFVPTVTQGIVSGTHRYLPGTGSGDLIYTDCIQVDAPINPGNSGGPLFNSQGRLVGINGRVSVRPERGKVNTGVGFAIPINQIKEFLGDLRQGRRVHHAILGVELVDGAATIKTVLSGSAADKAGMLVGDVIRRFQGHEVLSDKELVNRIGTLPAGKLVNVLVERSGRQFNMDVLLGERPTGTETALAPEPPPSGKTPEAPDDATPRAILDRYANAVGGYEAQANIRDTITSARVQMITQGLRRTGTVVQYEIGSTIQRQELKLLYGTSTITIVSFYDRASGWIHSNGQLVDLTPEQLVAKRADIEAMAQLTDRDGWRDAQPKLVGNDTVDGKKCVVISTRDRRGIERKWSFDTETGLLVRHVIRDPGNGQIIENRFGDYRPVGALKVPFLETRLVNGDQTEVVQIESVEFNRQLREIVLRDKPPIVIGPRVY